MDANRQRLRDIIAEKSLLDGGDFTLASGQKSAYFFNMKKTMLDPEGSALIAKAILEILADLKCDAIGGLEMGAVPILAVVCAESSRTGQNIPAFFVRKAKKGHGTDQLIDGNLEDGSTVVLLEDVTTTGGSVMQAVNAVRARGCTVEHIVTIVDREEGATANLKEEGLSLIAVYSKADF